MLVEFTGPAVIEASADAGFDFVVIDNEHGNQTSREIEATISAGTRASLATIVRPPSADRAVITRVLDAGAAGVLVPFTATMDDVRAAVRATKYQPIGRRGTHLFRGHTRHRPPDPATFMAEANRDLLTAIQIELSDAVELVEPIAATDGVDMLYVGPGDLSVDLGIPGEWDNPRVLDVMRSVAAACRKHGKIAACHVGAAEHVPPLHALGIQMFGTQCDIELYHGAARRAVDAFQRILQDE
jgi:2-dehydro-3-deoxyglucarate aldolase/4-hydroxy-2-oxoheptanedioate aldolase